MTHPEILDEKVPEVTAVLYQGSDWTLRLEWFLDTGFTQPVNIDSFEAQIRDKDDNLILDLALYCTVNQNIMDFLVPSAVIQGIPASDRYRWDCNAQNTASGMAKKLARGRSIVLIGVSHD